MKPLLRVLVIEDSEDDALQALRLLKAGGYVIEHERVESREALRAAMDRSAWDVVIADFRMPGFGGLSALAFVRERDADLPFIVVSGTIGEDTAVAMMKAGASDYVMKKDLARLLPAVERELRDAAVRREGALAREALRESEERFRQLAENIRDVFFLQDLTSSRIFYVSPAYEELWGRSCESLYDSATSWSESIHPDDHDAALAKFTDGVATGFDYEFRIVRPDGEPRWVRLRGFPIRDDKGKPYRIACVAADISRRKRSQEKLRASESMKGAILEASPDCIVTVDLQGRIVEFNPAAQATFGISRGKAIGQPVTDLLVPPRLQADFARAMARLLETGESAMLGRRFDLFALRGDATEFPVEVTVIATGAGADRLLTAFIRDRSPALLAA